MAVELLHVDGCPGHARVRPVVRRLSAEAGVALCERRIASDAQARAERFLGSPTVRVDGADVEPGADRRADYGLGCRLYRTADGLGDAPAEAWIRGALTLRSVLGGSRWAEARLAALDGPARRMYGLVLRRFAEAGRPPARAELDPPGAAQRLAERDLIRLGADGEVAVAYPFSAAPTRSRVELDDGGAFWAMCAVDAFGIAHLTGRRARVVARPPGGDAPVTVWVDPAGDRVVCEPASAVALVASTESAAGLLCECVCPHVNLLGSAAAAERHLAAAGLRGGVVEVAVAADAGRRLFGGLLDRLAEPAGAQ